MAQIEHHDKRETGPAALIRRILHPLVIVVASLVIAGGALLSGAEVRSLVGDDASLLKLLGGSVFLVLIAIFFQQRTQIRLNRDDLGRHYRRASDDLDSMIGALRERTGSKG